MGNLLIALKNIYNKIFKSCKFLQLTLILTMLTKSSQIYQVVPGSFPLKVSLKFYRGSTETITLLATESDGETPFDLKVFDGFRSKVKSHPLAKTSIAKLEAQDFVLGQSDKCISYISDQGLPNDSIHDELHCIFNSSLLAQNVIKKLYSEIDAFIGDEVYTLCEINLRMKYDTT